MRRAAPLLLALCLSCAGIIGNLIPGGAPTLWFSGIGVRYAPAATPQPGMETLCRAIAEVLEGERANGWNKVLWLDVLGASDSFNGRSGIGHTPFATPPNLAGTISLENGQPIAIGKQAQKPGDPIPHPCEGVLPWEVSRVVRSVETGHQLDLDHSDPESNRIMGAIKKHCSVLRATGAP